MAVQELRASPTFTYTSRTSLTSLGHVHAQTQTQSTSSRSNTTLCYCRQSIMASLLAASLTSLGAVTAVHADEGPIADDPYTSMYDRGPLLSPKEIGRAQRHARRSEAARLQRQRNSGALSRSAEPNTADLATSAYGSKPTFTSPMLMNAFSEILTPRFTTYDNRIFTPSGEEFIAKGINVFPWHDTDRDVDSITDCWNFNLVRVHSWILPELTSPWKDHVVYFDEPLTFDPSTVDLRTHNLVPLIDRYTEAGIVVVLSLHDFIGGYYDGEHMADYLQVLEQVATRYKDNPYLWIDIHNEPGRFEGRDGDYSTWRSQMTMALDTVRAIAPDMILWLSGTAWGQDTGPRWGHANVNPAESALLANDDIVNAYDNLVLTVHTYDQWQFGEARLENYFDMLMQSYDKPIIVGEYGPSLGGNSIPTPTILHNVLDQADYASVGRVAWTWAAWDANDLVDRGDGSGYRIDDCAIPSNLTDFGQLVWDDNHAAL